MQDDITDGVEWLGEAGHRWIPSASPSMVAATAAMPRSPASPSRRTSTPAAVDYVGVSNMFTFMTTIPPYWEPGRKMFYEMVGDPAADKDSLLMREASPVFFVDRIKCPLFIAQGANDPRVNKNESDQVVEALKARGVEVEYMVKDNEGHGFHNEENRFDFYNAMEKFLDQHIGSGYKPADAEEPPPREGEGSGLIDGPQVQQVRRPPSIWEGAALISGRHVRRTGDLAHGQHRSGIEGGMPPTPG